MRAGFQKGYKRILQSVTGRGTHGDRQGAFTVKSVCRESEMKETESGVRKAAGG